MGREWYQWGSKSSKNRAKSSGRTKPPPPPPEIVVAAAAASSGCMGVVSHLFDFHSLQFCLDQSSSADISSLKGVEAPRNSLETQMVEIEQDGDDSLYSIPMGIEIKTGRRDTRLLRSQSPSSKTGNTNYFSSSESESSTTPHISSSRRDTKLLKIRAPRAKTGEGQEQGSTNSSPAGPRTPNLVARLMGLDLIPEGGTPRSSNAATPQRTPRLMSLSGNGGTYEFSGSLPETPKICVGGRRSDADGYSFNNRRLSLQINKENRQVELPRHSCSEINTKRRRDLSLKGMEDENMISRSPSYYAKQIMKQVKESVMRRRFGSDITNKTGEKQSNELQFKNRPQINVLDETPKPSSSGSNDVVANSSLSPIHEMKQQRLTKMEPRREKPLLVQKVKQDWRITKRSPQMNMKEEQFVRATTKASQGSDKKSKTTPLSSGLLVHGNRVKKSDPSINRNPIQGQATTLPPTPPARLDATSRSESSYISKVLKRAGINRDTPVSTFTRWYSQSHPLDPCLFHFLEAADKEELRPRCNRRLMFDLVDEIMAHIIRPPKEGWARLHGFQVMRMVWNKVKGFPRADCRILQDIDDLVEMDISGQVPGVDMGFVAGEDEQDDIVAEVEKEIVEALLLDTTVAVAPPHNGYFLTRTPY